MTADIVAMLHKATRAAKEYNLLDGYPELWREYERAVTSNLPPSLAQVGYNSPVALLGWAHKYLAICRPDVFSFHHQSSQLAGHLVQSAKDCARQSHATYLIFSGFSCGSTTRNSSRVILYF